MAAKPEGSEVPQYSSDEIGASEMEKTLTVAGLGCGRRLEIRVPARQNAKLRQIVAAVNADLSLYQLWCCANTTAGVRLGMSDHGPVHVQVVANISLKLFRMIVAAGAVPSLVRDYGMTTNDAETVVLLGSLLHDIGMAIHRADHEHFSLILAGPQLERLLATSYPEPARTAIMAETLHAIIGHRAGGHPLTVEAGVVRVGDALDMAHGRSRIPFEAGQMNIHSVSAAAIERVELLTGEAKPVRIAITMSNSAGIFQIDSLLKDKLEGSGLEPYIEVEATIAGASEKRLIEYVRF